MWHSFVTHGLLAALYTSCVLEVHLFLFLFYWKRHKDILIEKKVQEEGWEILPSKTTKTQENTQKTNELPIRTNPYGVHTTNQSSWITLRGVPLNTLEQKAQREARKTIESQRNSEFLVLSSRFFPTTQLELERCSQLAPKLSPS